MTLASVGSFFLAEVETGTGVFQPQKTNEQGRSVNSQPFGACDSVQIVGTISATATIEVRVGLSGGSAAGTMIIQRTFTANFTIPLVGPVEELDINITANTGNVTVKAIGRG